MSSIDAFTTRRGRGEGPRRKSGRGTETAGTDAIDGLNSNRVDGVRSGKKNCKIHHRVWKLSKNFVKSIQFLLKGLKGEISLRSRCRNDCRPCVNIVMADMFPIGLRPIPCQG